MSLGVIVSVILWNQVLQFKSRPGSPALGHDSKFRRLNMPLNDKSQTTSTLRARARGRWPLEFGKASGSFFALAERWNFEVADQKLRPQNRQCK